MGENGMKNKKKFMDFMIICLILITCFVLFNGASQQVIIGLFSKVIKVSPTTVISLIALTLSFLNFIENHRKAKIITSVGENIIIAKRTDGPNSDLMHIPVTFTNLGSLNAVIKKCQVEIFGTNNTNPDLKWTINWSFFCKTEGGNWENESIVFPVSINGKSSFSKIITFSENTGLPFHLISGDYIMIFRVWIYGKDDCISENNFSFSVSTENEREHIQNTPSHHTHIKIKKL
jgi:hypothetical protein